MYFLLNYYKLNKMLKLTNYPDFSTNSIKRPLNKVLNSYLKKIENFFANSGEI